MHPGLKDEGFSLTSVVLVRIRDGRGFPTGSEGVLWARINRATLTALGRVVPVGVEVPKSTHVAWARVTVIAAVRMSDHVSEIHCAYCISPWISS